MLASGVAVRPAESAADPGACFIDRGLTDAIALCHNGDGSSVLEVECLGISALSTPGGPILGQYPGVGSAPSVAGQPMRASCWTSSTMGITTRAFVAPAVSS
ncbi:hypothetical protein DFR70_11027 [Nocardia tenerifensis]|uniref:Uncharacterized protein n=1 Tax=Nocardia tenerifensis TaxID=228006 RepID=A0A318KHP7_9NOCA|nr:hypothetical protein DFR70_11027 [Nocardia tenerifensis]